jgi:hypothetical protein
MKDPISYLFHQDDQFYPCIAAFTFLMYFAVFIFIWLIGRISGFLVVSLYVVDLYRWFTHLYLCQIAN